MAASVPTVAMVMQKSFNRPRIVEALEMFGVRAHARTGAKALQAQLLQLIREGGDGKLVDGAAAAARVEPRAATQSLMERLAASGGTFKADDITFSVRTMLDESAHALPGSMAALKPIQKQISVVRACVANSEPVPDKLHRTIRACLAATSAAARDAMLAALELDLGVRIAALADKNAAMKQNTHSTAADARGPDPVLKAMGVDGLDRALWEYYKADAAKKPIYGQRAWMSYAPESYIGQLHASLSVLLDPRVVQSSPHMHSPKALRDFVVGWCFYWQCCRPPFQREGDRAHWTCDQWELLPLHEIEDADGSRVLLRCSSVNDDAEHESDGEVPTIDVAAGGDDDEGHVVACERQMVLTMVAEARAAARMSL